MKKFAFQFTSGAAPAGRPSTTPMATLMPTFNCPSYFRPEHIAMAQHTLVRYLAVLAVARQSAKSTPSTCSAASAFASLAFTCSMTMGTLLAPLGAWAQSQSVTPSQRTAATQAAQKGVPLTELSPTAPDRYTVKRGDTLWGISTLFLTSPWRWPELWGMNMTEIRNPHRIFPGQLLVLDKSGGRATLRIGEAGGASADDGPLPVVKVSPRTRFESLADAAIASLSIKDIEPFLAQPLLLTAQDFASAARIVATQEGRVLLSKGDLAYARQAGTTLTLGADANNLYRIVRSAKPLVDPDTGLTLGLEAEYVGQAELIRSEGTNQSQDKQGKAISEVVPATLEIIEAAQEARTQDRLVREPAREFLSFVPRAPSTATAARIVAVYGSGATLVSTNQVVVLNRGAEAGMERGHVLALLRDGARETDRTTAKPQAIKLPNERSGLIMVFKAFDKVSYALVLSTTDALRVGDRVVNPR